MVNSVNRVRKIFLVLLVFLVIFGIVFAIRPRVTALPNVVLITVDALRADHLSCYGYKRKTSPNIDNLASQSVIFTNCYATSSNTIYASLGLFTGKYLATDKLEPSLWDNILDAKFKTLAEHLKGFGYSTMALIAGNKNYAKGKGFEQGFDYFCNMGRDGGDLTRKAMQLLEKHPKNKPFFIWIHYLETHAPYIARPEYLKQFESDALYKENDKILSLRPDGSYMKLADEEYTSHGYIPAAAFHNGRYSLNYYIACYDAQILYADFCIGKLLKSLNDDTLIILTADHGEALGEHNIYFAHGENIYDETLHIPLIIKDSRYFRMKKDLNIVSAVDIVPTILSRIKPSGYFLNKLEFDGIDLESSKECFDSERKYIYSYYPLDRSIRDVKNNLKYILSLNGKERLFILPNENDNLMDSDLVKDSVKQRLRRDLRDWLKDYPIPADINSRKEYLDKDTRESLKSLGYLQ